MARWFVRSPSSVRGLWMPGVSRSTIWLLSLVRTPRIWLRVVCGRSETIETFEPTSWFRSVDFPTLGRPTSVTKPLRKPGAPSPVTATRPCAWERGSRCRPRARTDGSARVTMRRPWTCSVRNSSPWNRTASPSSGTWPRRLNTRPPTVSHSVSGSSTPSSSFTSSIGRAARRPAAPPSGRRSTPGSSTSYSSTISPTISSRRSSRVTSPAVPPYSSITIAMWNFSCLHLPQQLGDPLLLGHEHRRRGQLAARTGDVPFSRGAADEVLQVRRARGCRRASPRRRACASSPPSMAFSMASSTVASASIADHVGAGHHHLPDDRVAELEDRVDEPALLPAR